MSDYCCRSCWQVVETYTPTGTRQLRAMPHDHPGTNTPCSGRHDPVLPLAFVERERAANAAWRAARDAR